MKVVLIRVIIEKNN